MIPINLKRSQFFVTLELVNDPLPIEHKRVATEKTAEVGNWTWFHFACVQVNSSPPRSFE